MRYFLIEENSKITQRARIINWYEKIDVRNICPENAHKLPQRELVFIMDSAETIFIDVISTPFFLASKKVMKTIQMYEPRVMLKELVLLGRIYEKVERYYLPIFEEVECLGHGSVLNLNRSEVKKIVLDKSKVKGHSIFRVAGVEKQYIVGNLDIIESILKRGCVGIKLTELDYR